MKIVDIIADAGHAATIESIAEQHGLNDVWLGPVASDDRQLTRLQVQPGDLQKVLDALQSVLGTTGDYRITVLTTEVVLPRPRQADDGRAEGSVRAAREALYHEVARNARLDRDYLLLVVLSTVVATIGLIENNVAVVIGAMVIAPLLGPNLALALATALGDLDLMGQALRTSLGGLGLAVGLALLVGWLWPAVPSAELLSRTNVGLDSVALALASGGAAALSITSSLPAVLVGVMVAVALLPPAATFGLMLGADRLALAAGAGLLLAVNIVCVNLAAKIVFLVTGIRPRTWFEQHRARQSMTTYIVIWVVSLVILLAVIYLRR